MRAHDWTATRLGRPDQWPQGLKVPLQMLLTSRFEMWLGWGPDLAFFYNDAYIHTLGVKHPAALGRPVREVWKEIFADLEHRIVSVMRDGVATWDKALMLMLERSGSPEETYHTFSYSPLRGDKGAIEGMMCIVTEETERVIGERRLGTLFTLSTALLPVRSREDIRQAVRETLQKNTRDFPFSFVHFFDEPAADNPLEMAPWPFDKISTGTAIARVSLKDVLAEPPKGPWDVPAREAAILPINQSNLGPPVGALVLGLNPYRLPEKEPTFILTLIAGQISAAVARVEANLSQIAETRRLQQLFEQSPNFIAVLRGPEHRFELANPGYLQLIGHREVVGRTVRDALPELEGQGFFELLDQVYSTGEPFKGQSLPALLQRTANSEPENRFLDFVYQPIRNVDGTVTGIFVEGNDITAAHNVAVALRESEAQFRTLTEAMLNHVWTAYPDGNLNWFNSQVYEYSGARQGELDGPGWAKIVHPDDIGATLLRWKEALSSGNPYETEFRLRSAGGEYRWHIARAVALRADDGSITRWIGTNTDIHQQKIATEALADLNATLEDQVTQRTGALMAAEEALRQSQKMEAVGQLTGGIAHDFNNLLTGISGSLELLDARIAQRRFDAIPRYLEAAQGAAKRAAALTQRLLAFSRRQTLDPRPVNINRMMGDMEELIRRTVGPAVEMAVVGAGGIWLTLVDQNQLENSLLNLCINARDAMPEGGKLTIETANKWLDERSARERDLPPGQYVSLCVTDTGTGMTPEVMARAFDPFFTTKPLGQGTGLGLSMTYGFVRQSGGQVRIYSEVGLGTTMCLYLPRHLGSETDVKISPADAAPSYHGYGETVLVVDDDSTVRMLVLDVLEEAGYNAIEAADGATGLRVLQTDRRVDLLVTDVGLPGGINGRQVADAGRALRPGLKVLFITGYAENAVVSHGHLEPGMQIITKPFAVELLGNKIRDMLDER